MYYIGLMSGTSMDAVDAALVQIQNGSIHAVEYEQFQIPDDIRNAVRRLSAISTIDEISSLDQILGHLFADAVLKIINQSNIPAAEIVAIGSHGQTILHKPDADHPRTLQIGDANIIAHATGLTTVADFRRMDMAAGGQGAPLAPAFHAHYFRSNDTDRVILNIGGIANITILPSDPDTDVTGFDTGPGNGLLDDWNQNCNATEMDRDGAWAASGKVNEELLAVMLNAPFFHTSPPKSTGRDDFNLTWINNKLLSIQQPISTVDVQATLLALTKCTIANAVRDSAGNTSELFVCGGGVHNIFLMEQLSDLLSPIAVSPSNALGINPDAVEAMTFAWLAKCRLDGRPPGNLPPITGAKSAVVLGAVYTAR